MIRTYPPSIFFRVIIHDTSEDHEFGDATLQKSNLIFLAHAEKGRDLLGHPDDPLYGEVRQVDDGNQVVRLRGEGLVIIEKTKKCH